MAHHHHHHHSHNEKNIALVLFLNLGFAIVEFFGGLWTGSLAILADSLHDAGDVLALALSYFLERKASQKSNQEYSYGYRRFSLLGALINSVILLTGSAWVISEAIDRLQNPSPPYAPGMIGLALLGLLVNGAGYVRLRGTDNLNQRMVSLHLLEDLFGWVVILIASLALMVWDLPFLDPLCSILFSAVVATQVFKALKETLKILLMSTPVNVDVDNLKRELCNHPHIDNFHDFHLWTLDGNYNVLTCHLSLNASLPIHEQAQLKAQIKEKAAHFGIEHVTLEIEAPDEECAQINCTTEGETNQAIRTS